MAEKRILISEIWAWTEDVGLEDGHIFGLKKVKKKKKKKSILDDRTGYLYYSECHVFCGRHKKIKKMWKILQNPCSLITRNRTMTTTFLRILRARARAAFWARRIHNYAYASSRTVYTRTPGIMCTACRRWLSRSSDPTGFSPEPLGPGVLTPLCRDPKGASWCAGGEGLMKKNKNKKLKMKKPYTRRENERESGSGGSVRLTGGVGTTGTGGSGGVGSACIYGGWFKKKKT